MIRFLSTTLILLCLPLPAAAGLERIHGPIACWLGGQDPTSELTLQWIERLEANVPGETWLKGKAGFGYADDDDETELDMFDRYTALYTQARFSIEGLEKGDLKRFPVLGLWSFSASTPDGEYKSTIEVTKKENGRLLFKSEFGTVEDYSINEKEVKVDVPFEFSGITGRVKIAATYSGEGKMEGEWKFVGQDDKEVAQGKWVATHDRNDEPKPEKPEEKPAPVKIDKLVNEGKYDLVLKIRYDDAFIAYLNGTEVARRGVKGRGRDVSEVVNHEATDKEEEIKLDKKFLRLLREGKDADNVIAIEGHNEKVDSTDFTLDARFTLRTNNDAKKDRDLVGKNAEWLFYLGGQPQEDWTTADLKGRNIGLPENTTSFTVRYTLRGKNDWRQVASEPRPFADTGHIIHRATLTGLTAGSPYRLAIRSPGNNTRLDRSHFFVRTMPAQLTEPFKFVAGGDMYHKRQKLDAMNAYAGRRNPQFALLGGDLAYANAKTSRLWYDWIDSWHENCVSPDDFMIPMIAVIGNHEVDGSVADVKPDKRHEWKEKERAKFYYSLFLPDDRKPHFAMDFSDYLSIVCADSDHSIPVGEQTAWMEETLKARQHYPNLFACYHRPAYGTQVKEDHESVRKEWVPLFEKYSVDTAFEHDHHVYKRTLPLKENKIDKNGVVYIGDGAWAVEVRNIPVEKTYKLGYVIRSEKYNHLIEVTLHENRQQYDAYQSDGKWFDSYVRFRTQWQDPTLTDR